MDSPDLLTPPTEEETSRLLMALGELVKPTGLHILRRLLFQRDRLIEEVKRLKAGGFTEQEFQNLCHGFDDKDVCRFKQGCIDYQQKLFGSKAVDDTIRQAIDNRHARSTRSFSIQTEQGQLDLTEYILDTKIEFPSGLKPDSPDTRVMVWQRRNTPDKYPPLFWEIFIHDNPASFIFQTPEADEARKHLLDKLIAHYGIQKVVKTFLS